MKLDYKHKKHFYSILILLACLIPQEVRTQGFVVSALFPSGSHGNAVLTVFDNSAAPRIHTAKVKNGVATFKGSVVGTPYAELSLQSLARPIPLFVENSVITVNVNPDEPEASRVNGSRSNSMLRYQLEQCGCHDNTEISSEEKQQCNRCIASYISDNPSSSFSPYLIFRFLATDIELASNLYGSLSNEATKTWHYKLLGEKIERMRHLQPGCRPDDLLFVGSDKQTHHLDSLLLDSCYHLVMVSATWCDRCDAVQQSEELMMPDMKIIRIDIDRDKQGWDSPVVRQFDVEYLPHIILLDPDGLIVANDIRLWELNKLMNK